LSEEDKKQKDEHEESIFLKELMAEDEQFEYPNEEMKYQLPMKLLDAAEKISRKIMNLKKDEFGDLVLDVNMNTKESIELKQASEVMDYWINKLLSTKTMKKEASIFKKKVETQNQIIQV
jgi:hypothetical protein